MKDFSITDDNNFDNPVDEQIASCLDLDKPVSFFLFAGAGSGKTGSLIKALKHLKKESGRRLHMRSQKIGVITYTNAACDEIKQRIDFDPLIEVSTIHSFSWSLIKSFHIDIKNWLLINLQNEIAELHELRRKGRAGTKAYIDRENSIISKTNRLNALEEIKYFTYNPNGDNYGSDSLNHSEVIKIGSDFLANKPLMQNLLVSKFPILFIDESQDTNKHLMEALLKVQAELKDRFVLGLFGDMMQRIYADGKIDLGQNLPSDWIKPSKMMNHRCPKRVINLINKIRSEADGHNQKPRTNKDEGFVRLYILPHEISDKKMEEQKIANRMSDVTGDKLWNNSDQESVKILILEHHMAARRMGFFDMYEPLYKIDRFRTGLLDGTLSSVRFFSDLILPLIKANQKNDYFAIASIARKRSPLLKKSTLKEAGNDQIIQLKKAKDAVESLINLWSQKPVPLFLDVLHCVYRTGLFEIPEVLHRLRGEAQSSKPQ